MPARRKAIIPAGNFGTGPLPARKTVPDDTEPGLIKANLYLGLRQPDARSDLNHFLGGLDLNELMK